MKHNKTLQPFRNQVFKHSVLHSSLLGILIGLIVAFMTALVSWFFGYDKGLLVSILAFIGAAVISGVALYFTKFRVTDSLIARRVDSLGLKERAITMVEYENDNSYVAKRQREDAEDKIKMLSPKRLKFRIDRKVSVYLAVAAVLSSLMMIIYGLTSLGILPSGLDIFTPEAAPAEILVTYEVDEGGSIDGDEDQIILPGDKTEPVLAVADEGWVFVGWSDGYVDPYREGDVVQEDTIFTALFEEMENEEELEDGGNGGPSQGPGDQPSEGNGSGNGNGNGNGQGQGEGNGQGDGAGGTHSASNNIIDGNTDYGPYLSSAIESAIDSIVDGGGNGSVIGDIVGDYFGGL